MAITVPRAATEMDVSVDASHRYVDWGAILAGAFVAAAISSVFLAFGSAIGLSLTSFQSGSSLPAAGLVIAAGLWLLWVQVSGFVGGGYIAGRMRRRIGDGTPHEAEMRDGAHGLLVWAVGIVAGALLAALVAMAGIAGVASVAGQTAANPGAVDYYVDRMLRADGGAPSATSTSTDTSTSTSTTTDTSTSTSTDTSTSAAAPASTTSTGDQSAAPTQQIARVVTRSLGGPALDDSDRSYLVREVSTRTGLAQADAEKRVDETLAAVKAQADRARRYGILLAFLTAASLLVSAVGAWWAACAGGRHRNEGVDHSQFSRWR